MPARVLVGGFNINIKIWHKIRQKKKYFVLIISYFITIVLGNFLIFFWIFAEKFNEMSFIIDFTVKKSK